MRQGRPTLPRNNHTLQQLVRQQCATCHRNLGSLEAWQAGSQARWRALPGSSAVWPIAASGAFTGSWES